MVIKRKTVEINVYTKMKLQIIHKGKYINYQLDALIIIYS